MNISEKIWNDKYRFQDETLPETFERIATFLSSKEKDQQTWRKAFYQIMQDFSFISAGRIIAGAGAGRNVTLSNCYVMGTIPDSMDGIFDHLKEAALTMQAGGGIGYDFSPIRPRGAAVVGVGAEASGPLSFMDCWNSMCKTVMSAGARRGAMMATMDCTHPDILDFISVKADPTRLRNFNLSVLVSDAFMEAVKNDELWHLYHEKPSAESTLIDGKNVYRTLPARELWDKIMKSTYAFAEPGVIFIDRVNREHNLWYIDNIRATNPCGEKAMGPYDSCLLGSINLARFVRNPFTAEASIDADRLVATVHTAIRLMDNVIDVNYFPLPQQEAKARETRQLGLGVTGLADMLAMLRLTYGENPSLIQAEQVMKIITTAAYDASIALAKEKGAFPAFEADNFLSGKNFAATKLSLDQKKAIEQYGIRNSLLTSIAPTGTISLFAGNVSSGVEPIFAFSYERKVLQPDGSYHIETVEDFAVQEYWRLFPEGSGHPDDLPSYFISAQTLSPAAHVRMQAALQFWTDSSISKTINCPEDISFEDFKAVYQLAYDTGCKGCTTYRPNAITGSVLSITPPAESAPAEPVEEAPQLRPDELEGSVYKIKLNNDALYITIADIEDENGRRPFEVFISTKNPEHFAWTTALTRMISAIFRRPHDSAFVAEELKAVFDPKGGGWWRGQYWPSEVAAIGQVIEDHMLKIGYLENPNAIDPDSHHTQLTKSGMTCPSCHATSIKHEGGCYQCLSCGHSKCG